ncbi:hypothetical protein [Moraxella porci]|uniref:hypothetical protein n=1 Tax=Moraxella porci TaxID=1288392 RepID=UPI0024471C46|nr:hypothetical protein [Moraxella porci]MDH2273565.1 hypothetical protein [Moraxella porci]
MAASTQNQLTDIEFLRAFVRANNAIEGVVLSEKDKLFMDNIDPKIDKQAFKELVLNHIRAKRS